MGVAKGKFTYIAYISLFVLYSLISALWAETSAAKIVLGVIFSWSAFIYIQVLSKYKMNIYLRGLNVLFLFFLISGILLLFSGEVLFVELTDEHIPNYTFLKYIIKSLLPIFACYMFARTNKIGKKTFLVIYIIYFVFAIVSLVQISLTQQMLTGETSTNNAGYSFLFLMPLLLFIDKKWSVLFGILSFAIIFVAQKRGAIIIALITSLPIIWGVFKDFILKNKTRFVFLLILVVVLLGWSVSDFYKSSEIMQARVEQTKEGGTSGRDRIFNTLWTQYTERYDITEKMVGSGANSTLKYAGNYAHNDWLEILMNQGLLGLIVYFYYWVCFFTMWHRMKKGSQGVSLPFGIVIIIYFISSFFSMSYSSYTLPIAMVLGYCLAEYERQERGEKIQLKTAR